MIISLKKFVEVEFWMDHDRVNRDLSRVQLWRSSNSQPIPWICCGSSQGFLARKFILFGVYSSWNSSEIYSVFRIIRVEEKLRFRRLRNKFYRSVKMRGSRSRFDNKLCCNSIFHPSIDENKILNLTWFLWFSDISNRKRLILNSRAKRLHTPGETTSHSGWNDFRLWANRLWVRAKRLLANKTLGETTCFRMNSRVSGKPETVSQLNKELIGLVCQLSRRSFEQNQCFEHITEFFDGSHPVGFSGFRLTKILSIHLFLRFFACRSDAHCRKTVSYEALFQA